MYRLQKLNVVKIVSSEKKRDLLLKKGFEEIQVPSFNIKEDTSIDYENINIESISETEFNNMRKDELIELAKVNNIEVDKNMIKKDIIRKIKESSKK